MIIPIYPKDFFDYSEGIEIPDDRINEWITDGFEYLKNNPNAQCYNNGSGNTTVTIFRELYGEYNVIIAKNYMESWVPL